MFKKYNNEIVPTIEYNTLQNCHDDTIWTNIYLLRVYYVLGAL